MNLAIVTELPRSVIEIEEHDAVLFGAVGPEGHIRGEGGLSNTPIAMIGDGSARMHDGFTYFTARL